MQYHDVFIVKKIAPEGAIFNKVFSVYYENDKF